MVITVCRGLLPTGVSGPEDASLQGGTSTSVGLSVESDLTPTSESGRPRVMASSARVSLEDSSNGPPTMSSSQITIPKGGGPIVGHLLAKLRSVSQVHRENIGILSQDLVSAKTFVHRVDEHCRGRNCGTYVINGIVGMRDELMAIQIPEQNLMASTFDPRHEQALIDLKYWVDTFEVMLTQDCNLSGDVLRESKTLLAKLNLCLARSRKAIETRDSIFQQGRPMRGFLTSLTSSAEPCDVSTEDAESRKAGENINREGVAHSQQPYRSTDAPTVNVSQAQSASCQPAKGKRKQSPNRVAEKEARKKLRKAKRKRQRRTQRNRKGSKIVVNRARMGSKIMPNKNTKTTSGTNDRTCLPLALSVFDRRQSLWDAMLAAMPPEGDTSVDDISGALSSHGLKLVPVTDQYDKTGGRVFNILQEHKCQLILDLKLVSQEGDKMYHSVGYDGQVVHDHPHNININRVSDRLDKRCAEGVFDKLYKEQENFKDWDVLRVWRLDSV